jgi:glycerate dehydrogenase
MKIVVLDGFTLNPGDLSWAQLEGVAACEIHDRTPIAQIVDRAKNADILFTNKTPLSRETLQQLPKLRYIGVLATGYNVVDTTAARERGIVVSNVPNYGTTSVAQHVFALLLELTQHVGHHAHTVRAHRWAECPDFCYWDRPLIELEGLTLGIVGYGRIGAAVAGIARAFGMRVIVSSRSPRTAFEQVSLDDLFKRSDVVSLHCPLTDQTRGLIDAKRLGLMKATAYLINTSRGPLIVENDLADALNTGRLAGAGLDVLSVEPPSKTNPLYTAKNCVITPHIAWATQAARRRLLDIAVENVRAFQAGTPQNVVT